MNTNHHNIIVNDEALAAISGLRHNSGTYHYYSETLNRLFATILHASDEIGMDEMEAISTLRVLDCIRRDLAAIAGPVAHKEVNTGKGDQEEVAKKVSDLFTGLLQVEITASPTPVGSKDGR